MAMRPRRLLWDSAELTDPDIGTVADLARLHLAARRLGSEVVLQNAPDALIELITFAGLAEVLRVEPRRQAEQRKERVGVEEERELGDPPV
jgi:ABC-type transporter Mla MlaB component